MSNKTFTLPDTVYRYLVENSVREPEILRKLREETATDSLSRMQIGPEQGQFMQLLVRMTGARRCLEIGVFTGYSSLAVALALPSDGSILACDISEKWTAIARKYWLAAGVADKIELKLAPALETLDELLRTGAAGSFDFAFIDADKVNYQAYFERALTLMRPVGLIAVDNTLWQGAVADPEVHDEDTEAIREFNRLLKQDPRVFPSMLSIGDGLSLALKL